MKRHTELTNIARKYTDLQLSSLVEREEASEVQLNELHVVRQEEANLRRRQRTHRMLRYEGR